VFLTEQGAKNTAIDFYNDGTFQKNNWFEKPQNLV